MGGTASVPTLSLDAGLTHYLAEIRKFPMLLPEQEAAYAARLREHGDRDAAYHLVTSHLRLVAKIAMRYRGYGLPIAGIISEGNLGLMQAVKRFEPERGFRLATYAMWWIKGFDTGIHPPLVVAGENGEQRSPEETVFQLRRTKAEISALEDGDLRPEHTAMIARKLGVQENEVVEMNPRLGGDMSLNALVHADEGGEIQDWLVDPASRSGRRVRRRGGSQTVAFLASGCARLKFAHLKKYGPPYALAWHTRQRIKRSRSAVSFHPSNTVGGNLIVNLT